jgi:hypothetical protein
LVSVIIAEAHRISALKWVFPIAQWKFYAPTGELRFVGAQRHFQRSNAAAATADRFPVVLNRINHIYNDK